MTPLALAAASIVVKMSVVLALTLAAVWVLRRRSAALRHWVLALGLTLSTLTPLTASIVPAWTMPAAWFAAAPAAVRRSTLVLSSTPLDMSSSAITAASPSRWTPDPVAPWLMVWFTGTLIALAGLGAGFVRLRRLSRSATPLVEGHWPLLAREVEASYGLTRRVLLLQSDHPALLVTWGLFRPRVFLPAAAREWPADRIRIVLRHELAHVMRGDWAVQVAAAFFGAVCWFNPLAWITVRRLRQESEYACDDVVLRHGVDGEQYATHLLAIARAVCRPRGGWIPAPAIARHSTLEQRIHAMLNRTSDRQPPTMRARLTAGAALGLAAVVVAGGALAAAATADVALTETRTAAVDAHAGEVPASVPTTPPAARAQASTTTQTSRASIAGVVLDQLGGLLPGTSVTVTSEDTGGATVTVTDRTGAFAFTDLRPGRYAVEARLPGFQSSRSLIALEGGRTYSRTISMSLGSLEETISVVGTRGTTGGTEAPRPRAAAPDGTARDPQTVLSELVARIEQAGANFRAGTVGGVIHAPAKVLHVNPVYPGSLQSQGVEGEVALLAVIGPDGQVAEVVQPREADTAPPVHPDLVAAATAAVQQWKFTPTTLNGVPVPVSMRVSLSFRLR